MPALQRMPLSPLGLFAGQRGSSGRRLSEVTVKCRIAPASQGDILPRLPGAIDHIPGQSPGIIGQNKIQPGLVTSLRSARSNTVGSLQKTHRGLYGLMTDAC